MSRQIGDIRKMIKVIEGTEVPRLLALFLEWYTTEGTTDEHSPQEYARAVSEFKKYLLKQVPKEKTRQVDLEESIAEVKAEQQREKI